MVASPVSISSEKPFSSASLALRLRKSGRTCLLRLSAMNTERGTVTRKTASRMGEAAIMPMSAPTTVTTLVAACRMSLEREAFTVSMS